MVNAKYERIGDKPCYPSIAALPETPDCVFIAVPRDAVEAVVAECPTRRGRVVLFSSGFGETALPERVAQQRRLVEIARGARHAPAGAQLRRLHELWPGR